ncbi:MAG: M23 family metallopeptidase [Acidimicrobiales bacterium]|nr:M23 family metallopeptidase [Acidimicrobiales bacterium]
MPNVSPTANFSTGVPPDVDVSGKSRQVAPLGLRKHRTALLALLALAPITLGACSSGLDAPRPQADEAPTTAAPAPDTTVAPTTTTAVLVHRFPIDPPDVAGYSPGHHDYPATDIFCPTGSRFVAPTSGTVDFVSSIDTWDPNVDDPASRGGLSVAIVGDDGVRYYGSHLSSIEPGIEPGVTVTAGQVLGLTGQSGNAANVDPHLHFGISHPTTPDDWAVRRGEVDTFPLLEAWKRGENVTPVVPAG